MLSWQQNRYRVLYYYYVLERFSIANTVTVSLGYHTVEWPPSCSPLRHLASMSLVIIKRQCGESMSVNGTPSEGVEQEDNKLDEVLASTAGGTLASEAETPETLNFIDTGDIA